MALVYNTGSVLPRRTHHLSLRIKHMSKKGFTTINLHSDRLDNPEHGVLHKAIHPSVAFGYKDARELAAVFQGKRSGYNYGRQMNPTVTALELNGAIGEIGSKNPHHSNCSRIRTRLQLPDYHL